MRRSIGWLVSVLILIGCQSQATPFVVVSATAESQPTARAAAKSATLHAPTRAPTATALTPSATDVRRTQYRFKIDFDQAQRHAIVTQTVQYVNATGEALDELTFVIEPNRLVGVFHVADLRWGSGQPIEDYTLDGARLRVPLTNRLAMWSSVTLSLRYEINVPEQAGPFGATPRQINFGDWYPFIPAYRAGQGWLIHEPGAAGEQLVYDVADYHVAIRLANLPVDSVVVASAPAEMVDDEYHYQLKAARNFAWSISAEYETISQTVETVAVIGYIQPQHLEAGRAALQATAQALELYSDLFAPYPHQQLSFVEADFPDGMEYDGLYFLGSEYFEGYQGQPQGYLTAIAVHETAHQWWYALVGNDQALEPWLDEALATYSELLFYEHVYPDLIAWWWQFRVKRFEPSGGVDSTIYEHAGFRSYVNAVYLRGALFMEEVRRQMGNEPFWGFLREYAILNAGRFVTADDVFARMRQHSPIDINTLKAAFFRP